LSSRGVICKTAKKGAFFLRVRSKPQIALAIIVQDFRN